MLHECIIAQPRASVNAFVKLQILAMRWTPGRADERLRSPAILPSFRAETKGAISVFPTGI